MGFPRVYLVKKRPVIAGMKVQYRTVKNDSTGLQ